MKLTSNQIPLWNHLKTSAKTLAVLALLGVASTVAQAQITYTPIFTNVWVVTASNYLDLPLDQNNNSRGIAISPLTTNVLYGSTIGGTNGGNNHVSTVAFSSGSNYLAQLNAVGVSGGIINVMNVRVSGDGSVYASNRRDGGASTFTIYRWPSETDVTTPAVKIVDTAFTMRMGDHMDVRGSGINTEIVVVGSSGSGATVNTNFVIFRPTDATLTTFTNFSIFIPGSGASVSVCGYGVTFEGTNNVVWVRSSSGLGNECRRIVYNPATMTATCARTNAVDQTACRSIKYYADTNGVEMLASVQVNTTSNSVQIARVFRIPTSPTAPLVSVLTSNFPAPYFGSKNGNGLGQVDVKNGYFAFGAPGYGLTFFKVGYTTTSPPLGLSVAGTGSTFIAGLASPTFTASVSGSNPLSYQWYFVTNGVTNLITGAITNVYVVTNVQSANVGGYFVIVTNLYGGATSSVANIGTVLPNGSSSLMTNLWTITGGSVSYVGGAGTLTARGLGYDPILQRVVVVSRAPTNGVWLLNAATGTEVGSLDLSPFNPGTPNTAYGTFAINMCGVADDGIVYVANLCNGASEPLLIYSFASATDGQAYGTAYSEAPGTLYNQVGRMGDSMAVRGAGTNTQIIMGTRGAVTNVVIFTTTDGINFTPNIVAINTANQEIAGLSVYWGAGNTFWAKTDSLNNVRQVSFNLNTLTGTVIGSFPLLSSETIIGVDSDNGYLTAVGTRENPQTLGVYDINAISATAPIDREFFAGSTVGANIQATGQSAVDVKGGRVFSLSTGTGILAVKYAGKLAITKDGANQIVSWPTTNATLQSATVVSGPYSDVSGATTPYTNTTGSVNFYRLRN